MATDINQLIFCLVSKTTHAEWCKVRSMHYLAAKVLRDEYANLYFEGDFKAVVRLLLQE